METTGPLLTPALEVLEAPDALALATLLGRLLLLLLAVPLITRLGARPGPPLGLSALLLLLLLEGAARRPPAGARLPFFACAFEGLAVLLAPLLLLRLLARLLAFLLILSSGAPARCAKGLE